MTERTFTPENITELKANEIFVFGSNLNGNHAGGAARTAVEKFGAIMGQAEGLQGQSYAIPTLDKDMQPLKIVDIKASVITFTKEAYKMPEKTFYVTKIGCGIAGFDIDQIRHIFTQMVFPSNVILPREFCVVRGWKAFRVDMSCNDKYYEEDSIAEESGEPVMCSHGIHFCESPFDTLEYYPLLDCHGNFVPRAQVEPLGELRTQGNKSCTNKLRIGFKVSLKGFIEACIDFIHEKTIKNMPTAKVSSGDSAQIGSSGDSAKIGSSGYSAQIGSSGDYAKIGSSGDYAKIGSSGYYAQIGSSGDYAKIGSSGYSAQIGSSGYSAQIESTGADAVIAAIGKYSKAKAKVGSWIVLAEYDTKGKPIAVVSKQVDGEILKADTFYTLRGGEFIKVND